MRLLGQLIIDQYLTTAVQSVSSENRACGGCILCWARILVPFSMA